MHEIGCVSFLNSKPLIDPVVADAGQQNVRVHFAVPANLLALIEAGTVSTGLLSVVDYQNSAVDLVLLPVGMIGCDGPTLTVRIYSRVPIREIKMLHADTDSHTSVILGQVILRERYGIAPPVIPLTAREGVHPSGSAGPEAMLLIGDKVVNASPDPAAYPHQLDLGEEWKRQTGLPFVFAMWMMRRDRLAGEGPAVSQILDQARQRGADMTEQLLDRYATEKGWPRDLARRYFTEYLRYAVTPAARQGMARFFVLAQKHGLLPARRAIEFYEPGA